MVENAWCITLLELSQPGWRPPVEAIGGGLAGGMDQDIPIIETAFSALWARWWDESILPRSSKLAAKQRRLFAVARSENQPLWIAASQSVPASPLTTPSHSEGDHPVMIAFVPRIGAEGGYLELALPADRMRINDLDRVIYLKALAQVRDALTTTATPTRRPPSLDRITKSLNSLRREMQRKFDEYLAALEGTRLESLAENQALAKQLQRLLDSYGFRVRCPECGEPAIMRCLSAGNSTTGAFVFDHYLSEGRTFHGGKSSIPKLEVVPKPSRSAANQGS